MPTFLDPWPLVATWLAETSSAPPLIDWQGLPVVVNPWAIILGFMGSIVVELMDVSRRFVTGRWLKAHSSPLFWLLRVLIAIFAGVFAGAYVGDSKNWILAIHVGVSLPVIINAMMANPPGDSKQAPKSEQR